MPSLRLLQPGRSVASHIGPEFREPDPRHVRLFTRGHLMATRSNVLHPRASPLAFRLGWTSIWPPCFEPLHARSFWLRGCSLNAAGWESNPTLSQGRPGRQHSKSIGLSRVGERIKRIAQWSKHPDDDSEEAVHGWTCSCPTERSKLDLLSFICKAWLRPKLTDELSKS